MMTPHARRQLGAGCLDPSATSYDGAATSHDSSMCVYSVVGCTDSTATNYLPVATAENTPSTCEFPREGCTISQNTLNYDSLAVQLAGCVYVQLGCTDSTATNFLPNANTDLGSCV